MRNFKTFLFILVGVILMTPSFAYDQNPEKIYRVGIFDTPPYNYKGDGTFHQNMLSLFEKAGLEVDITFVPFKRGLSSVMAGNLDIMVPLSMNSERAEKLLYLEKPSLVLPFYFIKRQDNDFEWSGDFNNLKGKRLSFYRGAYLSKQLEDMMAAGKVERLDVNDVEQMLRLVQSGRVDFGVTSQFTFHTGMKELNLTDQLVPMQEPLKTLNLYLAVNKEVPNAIEIVQRLNEARKKQGLFITQ